MTDRQRREAARRKAERKADLASVPFEELTADEVRRQTIDEVLDRLRDGATVTDEAGKHYKLMSTEDIVELMKKAVEIFVEEVEKDNEVYQD